MRSFPNLKKLKRLQKNNSIKATNTSINTGSFDPRAKFFNQIKNASNFYKTNYKELDSFSLKAVKTTEQLFSRFSTYRSIGRFIKYGLKEIEKRAGIEFGNVDESPLTKAIPLFSYLFQTSRKGGSDLEAETMRRTNRLKSYINDNNLFNDEMVELFEVLEKEMIVLLFETIQFDTLFQRSKIPDGYKQEIKMFILQKFESFDFTSKSNEPWLYEEYLQLEELVSKGCSFFDLFIAFPGRSLRGIDNKILEIQSKGGVGQRIIDAYLAKNPGASIKKVFSFRLPTGEKTDFSKPTIAALRNFYFELTEFDPHAPELLPAPDSIGPGFIRAYKWFQKAIDNGIVQSFTQSNNLFEIIDPARLYSEVKSGNFAVKSLFVLVRNNFFQDPNNATTLSTLRDWAKQAESSGYNTVLIGNVDLEQDATALTGSSPSKDQEEFIKTAMFGDGSLVIPDTNNSTSFRFRFNQALNVLSNNYSHLEFVIEKYNLCSNLISSNGLILNTTKREKEYEASDGLMYSWFFEFEFSTNLKRVLDDFYPFFDPQTNCIYNPNSIGVTQINGLKRLTKKRMPLELNNLVTNYFLKPFESLAQLVAEDGSLESTPNGFDILTIAAFTDHKDDIERLAALIYVKTGLKFYVVEKKTTPVQYYLKLALESANDFHSKVGPHFVSCFLYKLQKIEEMESEKAKTRIDYDKATFQQTVLNASQFSEQEKELLKNPLKNN